MDDYKSDRVGLVLAYWGVALHLGRPLVSQTDHDYEGSVSGGTYGSILNHITVGRHARRAIPRAPFRDLTSRERQQTCFLPCFATEDPLSSMLILFRESGEYSAHSKSTRDLSIHSTVMPKYLQLPVTRK